VLALGDPATGPQGSAVRTHPRRGGVGRAADALLRPWSARGRVIVVLDPDAVPAARAAGAVLRRPVVVDVHEDYAELARDRSWSSGAVGPVVRGVLSGVTRLSRGAALTVVADEQVPPASARQRLVLRNLPDLSMLPAPAPRDSAPRALYVGDVRASRGLFAMLDALELAVSWTLDVVGPVAAADEDELARRLAASPAAPRIRFHGRRPPVEAWALASGAWAGLSLLEPTPAFVAAVPSKVYEYLACGLAAVVSPLPRQAELVRAAAAGAVVGTAREAADVLERWAASPGLVEPLEAAARAWAARELGTSAYDDFAARVATLARH
jgi:glycosyltransferase involved in cell wall biosynthesis